MHPRHMKLLDLICQNGRLAVTELSAKLGVSEVTIRKDLNMLAHQGLLKREHGFACMVASDDIGHHLSFHYENKRRIAERAARCVQPGETVMIESGSCCTLLAEELCARDCHITIITNSAFIASFVHKMRSARIILLGGSYQNEAQVMVGPLVGLCARNFKVDKFFLGIDGMDERGVKSSDHHNRQIRLHDDRNVRLDEHADDDADDQSQNGCHYSFLSAYFTSPVTAASSVIELDLLTCG